MSFHLAHSVKLASFLALLGFGWASHARAQAMPDMSMLGEVPADVARLSDADANCEQLYAEATSLEKQIAAQPKTPDPMEAIRKMQDEMQKAQQEMMGGSRVKSLGTTLLSMVPGAGGVAAGALSSMINRPNANAMSSVVDKSMKAQQESMAIGMRTAALQARREHLTNLFLERQCRVSTLGQEAAPKTSEHQADGGGKDVDVPQPVTAKDGEIEVSPLP